MMMCRFPNFFKPNFSAVARIGGFKLHELMRDGREFPKRKKKRYEKK
jgi:tRNA U55 pseudouridine synthase TruB